MKAETLAEVLCAAHLSQFVKSEFDSCGGLMLVAPPGAFKTTMLNTVDNYSDSLVLTDINSQSLAGLREAISNHVIRSLVVQDMQKLWERNLQTAANLEGNLRALVDEGFKNASWEDARVSSRTARCVVMGGMTDACLLAHYGDWDKTGFLRRFLWVKYRLENPYIPIESILKQVRISINCSILCQPPVQRTIPDYLTEPERRRLHLYMKGQPGAGMIASVPLQLLCKLASVLKWHYVRLAEITGRRVNADQHMDVLADFAPSLSHEGAILELGEGEKESDAIISKKGTRKRPSRTVAGARRTGRNDNNSRPVGKRKRSS